jgi:hypothetical protein
MKIASNFKFFILIFTKQALSIWAFVTKGPVKNPVRPNIKSRCLLFFRNSEERFGGTAQIQIQIFTLSLSLCANLLTSQINPQSLCSPPSSSSSVHHQQSISQIDCRTQIRVFLGCDPPAYSKNSPENSSESESQPEFNSCSWIRTWLLVTRIDLLVVPQL